MTYVDHSELVIYAVNTSSLYPARLTACAALMELRHDTPDDYSKGVASAAFTTFVRLAMAEYLREFPGSTFAPMAAALAASSIASSFEDEANLGNYDYLLEHDND